jgi:hypothetical protein
MIKKSFKYNKPGHIKKLVLLDDVDMVKALKRQPRTAGFLKFFGEKLNHQHSDMKRLHKAVTKHADPGATLFPTPEGTTLAFSKSYMKNITMPERKMLLAHEQYHRDRKILGKSEVFAHIAGGQASGGKFFSRDGAGGELKHLFKSNTGRAILEAPLVPLALLGFLAGKIKKVIR